MRPLPNRGKAAPMLFAHNIDTIVVRKALVWMFAAAFAALVVMLALLLRQPDSIRSARLETTLNEIRRGNYYAWLQADVWLERLKPDERRAVIEACTQYASTNE